MKKIETTGSFASRQRSGRPLTAAAVATTVEQTVQSMSAVAAHGECSAREVSRQTGVSYGSVRKALRITLKRYPYKLQHKQELKPPDFDSRRDVCGRHFYVSKLEGRQAAITREHDIEVPPATHQLAQEDVATRFVLQERQEGHIPRNDDTQPLHLVVQRQNHSLHGQVGLPQNT
ncbi:transposable element tc3 transposase [Caerostris extrusa]|uniref:Transposable element tc3 transposase n=1 Tax=Caerostris extrusa TaxID=172846 RepID=A0AAV4VSW4_CAEEX|nr:transposable element tc3 transposase [Caerostris extrusa]